MDRRDFFLGGAALISASAVETLAFAQGGGDASGRREPPPPPTPPPPYFRQANLVSSGRDDGANAHATRIFWQPRKHRSTEQMLRNAASTTGRINICGHGSSGSFETGDGQFLWSQDAHVDDGGEFHWGPLFEKYLPPSSRSARRPIDIYSCYTGAGEEGAHLLWTIAGLTGRPVRARTGLTTLRRGRVHWQDGSTWQVASPNMNAPPPPIARPRRRRATISGTAGLFSGGGLVAVDHLNYTRVGLNRGEVKVEGGDAALLAAALTSIRIPPEPELLAAQTASGALRFDDGSKASFKVFGDAIALFLESGQWFEIDDQFRTMTKTRS